MKRGKVQAQRKFAQGVIIPPAQTTNNNNVERLRKDEVSNVTTFHNKMSASSLLDTISFKNLHLHLQNKDLEPVVRLERIEPKTGTREFSKKILKKVISKNRRPRASKLIVTKKKMVRLTRSTSILMKRKKPETDDIDDDTPLKYLRKSTADNKRSPPQQANSEKTRRTTKRKSRGSSVERTPATENGHVGGVNKDAVATRRKSHGSSVERTPVTENGHVGGVNKDAVDNKRSPPQQANSDKTRRATKQKLGQISSPKGIPLTENGHDDVSTDIGVRKRSSLLRVCSDKSQKSAEPKPLRYQSSKVEKSLITRNSNDVADNKRPPTRRMNSDRIKKCNSQPNVRGVRDSKIKKFPKQNIKLKSKLRKSSTSHKDKDHRDNEQSSNITKRNSAFDIVLNSLPETPKTQDNKILTDIPQTPIDVPKTSTDVLKTMEDDSETSTDVIIKAAYDPATLTLLPETRSVEQIGNSDTQCPSLKFATAKEVMDAPPCDLQGLCHKCSHCSRVDKVVEIARLVETPIDIDSDSMDMKLYMSDDEELGTDCIENQQRSSEMPRNVGESTRHDVNAEMPPDDDASYLYLDILPPTVGSVIQIKSSKIPNQDKQLTIARLMPKSVTNGKNEFNLVEHENLLDQLLETLNMHRSSGDNDPSIINHWVQSNAKKNPMFAAFENFIDLSDTQDEDIKLNIETDIQKGIILQDEPSFVSRENRSESPLVTETTQTPIESDDYCIPSTTKVDKRVKSADPTVLGTSKTDGQLAKITQTPPVAKDYSLPSTSRMDRSIKSAVPTAQDLPSTSRMDRSIKSAVPTAQETRKMDGQPANKNKTGFPKVLDRAKLVDALVYKPTEAEFNDPVAYFEKIMPDASKYGICKVVAPPTFKPTCVINDKIRFNVSNQYIARLYSRWGMAAKEMSAIKAYLATQSVFFTRAPFLDGLEVDLPRLYRTVQKYGGLNCVIEKKRWSRVAEEMRIAKGHGTKLDMLYLKYLVPYDTLSNHEREQIAIAVNKAWHRKNQKIQDRALNPLHRQKQLLGESETSEDDTEEEPKNVIGALVEAEDCIVPGRNMILSTFINAADIAAEMHFPANSTPQPEEVETEYWRVVLHGTDHVSVYTASVDSGKEGYGFPKNKTDEYAKHPWNLKMISQNSGNVLRSLGSVLGVTVPTLHLGMIFSTSCWHRDPHGLPWIEYMHNGPAKIWYGIPDEQSDKFRHAVEVLCPTSCQNKSIWLPSDIAMIPPNFLLDQGVSLSRVEQSPGEFIIVFPRAYSCSICTGYTVSESVYFATSSWLKTVDQVFQVLRESCEPTMFSMEQLLMSVARDSRSPLCVLQAVHLTLSAVVEGELQRRRELRRLGVRPAPVSPAIARRNARMQRRRPAGAWNQRDQDECQVCRSTLYLSKVTGLSNNKAAVCLRHALQLLARRSVQHDVARRDVSLLLFYDDKELHELVSSLQRRFTPTSDVIVV